MALEDFLLRIRANENFWSFLLQSSVILFITSSVITFFAFAKTTDNGGGMSSFQHVLRIVSYILWCMTSLCVVLVALTYVNLRKLQQRTVNAWGELVYEVKATAKNAIRTDDRAPRWKNKTFVSRWMSVSKNKLDANEGIARNPPIATICKTEREEDDISVSSQGHSNLATADNTTKEAPLKTRLSESVSEIPSNNMKIEDIDDNDYYLSEIQD